MSTEYDYLFKILLVGDSGVGKSCMLFQFCDEMFTDSYISTIGVDFKIKTIALNGQTIKLSIWDTAGQDRFKTITSSYYRNADGILICYDVTNFDSFNNVMSWIREIEKHSQNQACKVLVGTKCDLIMRKTVDRVSGEELASKLDIPFIETSSKTKTNINQAFENLAAQILSKKREFDNSEEVRTPLLRKKIKQINPSSCAC